MVVGHNELFADLVCNDDYTTISDDRYSEDSHKFVRKRSYER